MNKYIQNGVMFIPGGRGMIPIFTHDGAGGIPPWAALLIFPASLVISGIITVLIDRWVYGKWMWQKENRGKRG